MKTVTVNVKRSNLEEMYKDGKLIGWKETNDKGEYRELPADNPQLNIVIEEDTNGESQETPKQV